MALRFDVDLNDAGHLGGSSAILFGDLVLADTIYPLFNDGTVRQFLAHANQRLGGGSGPYTYDDLAALALDLTRAFEGGTPSQFAQQHLQLVLAPCPADWNDNGEVTSADITSFLTTWFTDLVSGAVNADFNESGQTTSADITAFLSAWFAALAGGC